MSPNQARGFYENIPASDCHQGPCQYGRDHRSQRPGHSPCNQCATACGDCCRGAPLANRHTIAACPGKRDPLLRQRLPRLDRSTERTVGQPPSIRAILSECFVVQSISMMRSSHEFQTLPMIGDLGKRMIHSLTQQTSPLLREHPITAIASSRMRPRLFVPPSQNSSGRGRPICEWKQTADGRVILRGP